MPRRTDGSWEVVGRIDATETATARNLNLKLEGVYTVNGITQNVTKRSRETYQILKDLTNVLPVHRAILCSDFASQRVTVDSLKAGTRRRRIYRSH